MRSPSNRRRLTPLQKRVLRAFVENDGRARVATGGQYEHVQPGLILLPVRPFAVIRERGWVEVDRERNAAHPDIGGHFLLTSAGRLVFQRGWFTAELGEI